MKTFCALKSAKDIGGKAPDEFRVFEFGEIEIVQSESVFFDKDSAEAVLKHFNALKHDMVIDYEHQTLGENKAPAAGWCTALTLKPDGLYAAVKWTDEAAGYLKTGEYRYFSPVFFYNKKTRKITGIYNLALTNQPRMKNIQALAAKLTLTQKKEKTMLKKLIEFFKLKDDANEDDALEACKTLTAENKTLAEKVEAQEKTEQVACKAVLDALDLDDKADTSKVCNAIAGLKAPATAAKELSQQVAKLTTEIAGMKRDDLVSLALKSGKTSPEELTAWGKELAEKSPEQFEKIVLSRPDFSVVPLQDLAVLKDPASKENMDEATIKIAGMMDVSSEDIKKYGNAE